MLWQLEITPTYFKLLKSSSCEVMSHYPIEYCDCTCDESIV